MMRRKRLNHNILDQRFGLASRAMRTQVMKGRSKKQPEKEKESGVTIVISLIDQGAIGSYMVSTKLETKWTNCCKRFQATVDDHVATNPIVLNHFEGGRFHNAGEHEGGCYTKNQHLFISLNLKPLNVSFLVIHILKRGGDTTSEDCFWELSLLNPTLIPSLSSPCVIANPIMRSNPQSGQHLMSPHRKTLNLKWQTKIFQEEMSAVEKNGTWELMSLPKRKSTMGYNGYSL
ncbi:hypothetical protein CK203_103737 [Vitis vinifera]|uniref:Uncharacterized protein n=1 Tax=Vitis vinifera TaxID=29760 RepID=A0A438D4H5_VITVI|nr:hypothetical protein CK203_103737 [Vitis vinifera]